MEPSAKQPYGELTRVYSHAEKIIELYKKLRLPLYNKLAWAAVVGGILIALGSFWTNLLSSLLDILLKENAPTFYSVLKPALDKSAKAFDNVDVIVGAIIIGLGLIYHWLASTAQHANNVKQYNQELQQFYEQQRHDMNLLERFFAAHSTDDFRKAVAKLAKPSGDRLTALAELNERYSFLRDPSLSFYNPDLQSVRVNVCKSHESLNAAIGTLASPSPSADVTAQLQNLIEIYQQMTTEFALRSYAAAIQKRRKELRLL